MLIKDAAHRPNVGAECVGPWKTVPEPFKMLDGRKALLIPYPAKLFQAHHLSLLETTYTTIEDNRRKYFQLMCNVHCLWVGSLWKVVKAGLS